MQRLVSAPLFFICQVALITLLGVDELIESQLRRLFGHLTFKALAQQYCLCLCKRGASEKQTHRQKEVFLHNR